MDKEHKITKILEDLESIDQDFSSTETFRPLVSRLLSMKPEVPSDSVFFENLRAKLTYIPEPDVQVSVVSKWESLLSRFTDFIDTSGRFASGLAGAAIALLVAIPLTYTATRQTGDITPPSVKGLSAGLTLKQQINSKGTNAFGTLALLPSTSTSVDVIPSGVKTDITKTSPVAVSTPVSTSTTSQVAFEYKGNPIVINTGEGTVFKRDKGVNAGKQLAGFLKGSNFGIANLTSFSNLDLKGIQFSQDQDHGYTLAINFDEGTVNIASDAKVPTGVSSTTLPSDSSLINTAGNFLASHSIDRSSYGQPFVDHEAYESNATDTITVVYPLVLGGQSVYDQSGHVYGLNVDINLNSKSVVLVENLVSQLYESSTYNLETDGAKIVAKLPHATVSPDAATATIEVGTPQRVLMRSVVTQKDGSVDELYIPAILFTASDHTTVGVPHHVIVPIVLDTLGASISQPETATTSVSTATTS